MSPQQVPSSPKAKADVQARRVSWEIDGKTALHNAKTSGMVEVLLAAKADIESHTGGGRQNETARIGHTPLHTVGTPDATATLRHAS